jgi:hypothetical protein
VKVIGASEAIWTPGASVSRGPGEVDGTFWPGRVVKSGPTVPTGVGVGVGGAAGLSATGGCSGAFTFLMWALA